MPFLKSSAAAKELGVPYYVLTGLLRYGKIDPPQKDSSGDYLWSPRDLDRARKALAAMRRPKRQPKRQEVLV